MVADERSPGATASSWGPRDAKRLAVAMAIAGLKQAGLKDVLLRDYNLSISQQQISSWLKAHDRPRADLRPSVESFIDSKLAEIGDLLNAPYAELIHLDSALDSGRPEPDEGSSVNRIQELVTARLKGGPPMSRWDYKSLRLAFGYDPPEE